jgi:predicted ATPase
VAAALGVPLGRTEVGAQLGMRSGRADDCLIILDNFEQVTVHAAATVGAWLDRAREASFVVTSREVLHVPGEMTSPRSR